jgi:predicted O-methyltransferase YrrM
VIEEKMQFYVFDEIEKFRAGLVENKNNHIETQHRNYGALLFRLAGYFDCRSVLQIRGYTGIMSLYLASASRKCECYVLENDIPMTSAAKRYADLHKIDNLHFMEGNYTETLNKLKDTVDKFDFIFINYQGDADKTLEVISLVRSFIAEKTILVIDSISSNNQMKTLWHNVKHNDATKVTVDLFAVGIVFFMKKLNKQHYKSYFDYGKKQNLYPKRRRRFHFAGWRKKSAKA